MSTFLKAVRRQIKALLYPSYHADGETFAFERWVISQYTDDPTNLYLVSFPRTGSHWFRMLAELYFERPSLVRSFYYPDNRPYLFLHTHDLSLDVERQNVIYLYRDPVPTIYSQMKYHQHELDDVQHIRHWADVYGKHLDKWLHTEQFTQHKTIITYEMMQANLAQVFEKVTAHIGQSLDTAQLDEVAKRVTKEEVNRKTVHDQQVVQVSSQYTVTRKEWAATYAEMVWDTVTEKRSHLFDYFDATLYQNIKSE